jgi:hypothetical protein
MPIRGDSTAAEAPVMRTRRRVRHKPLRFVILALPCARAAHLARQHSALCAIGAIVGDIGMTEAPRRFVSTGKMRHPGVMLGVLSSR